MDGAFIRHVRGEWMSPSPASRWIRFLRNYGPIPTNDNMYDESIQRALRRHRIEPLVLPAQFLSELLNNFRSDVPRSEVLTGTAGDGKTYHCRETWLALGGSEADWNAGRKVQRLPLGTRELVVVTRFEFLGRVAEGALPSSFSLECHEDLLAFKAKLLSATERRRILDEDEPASAGELVLRFIELGGDGRASPRRVTVRM